MTLYWLVVTASWVGAATSLPSATPSSSLQPPLDPLSPALARHRRFTTEDDGHLWAANILDPDQTHSIKHEDLDDNPYLLQEIVNQLVENITDDNTVDKRSFSPWGGKRTDSDFEYPYNWKRSTNFREPSPKRVRFSPWGGKRSGQLIYKPTSKDFKYVSQYSPDDLSPERHPIQLLALGISGDSLRESTALKRYADYLPKYADYLQKPFRMGQPYSELDLTKNGKRKAKFSAWGGKRSAPVIGPVWTPAPDDIKDALLNAILLVRNSQKKADA